MEQLINLMERYTPVSQELRDALERYVIKENVAKNDFILRVGQTCNRVWFLNKGMIRKFYLDGKGNEITVWIHFENEPITSLNSFFRQVPSVEYLQACEKSELLSLNYTDSRELSRFPQMEIFNQRHLQQFAYIDEVSKQFSLLDA